MKIRDAQTSQEAHFRSIEIVLNIHTASNILEIYNREANKKNLNATSRIATSINIYLILHIIQKNLKKISFSGKSSLKKIDLSLLPDYISKNEKIFQEWLE